MGSISISITIFIPIPRLDNLSLLTTGALVGVALRIRLVN